MTVLSETYRAKHEGWGLRFVGLSLVFGLLLFRVLTAFAVHVQLPARLQDLITLTTSVIIESFPFVILGILLSVIVQIWLPSRAIRAWLPQNAFLRRFYISFLGVLLPVCECGNLPLARGLLSQGFSVAESITFLLAAPILNPVTLLTTHQAFPTDTHILIARAVGALLIANVVGWLFSKESNAKKVLSARFLATCNIEEDHSHTKIGRSLDLFTQEVSNIMPALFVGGVIAGSIQVLVPRSILLGLGVNPVTSILAMIVLAGIVSICSNVDAFFALAFSSTFTAGAIVSFLVFGPMIDVKMLTLMRTTYTVKALLAITILVTLCTVIIGLAVNYGF